MIESDCESESVSNCECEYICDISPRDDECYFIEPSSDSGHVCGCRFHMNFEENGITELIWKEFPRELKHISFEHNSISVLNWENVPPNLESISFRCNNISEINWDGVPSSLKIIDLGNNNISEMNFKGAPSALKDIILILNNISELNFNHAPSSLEWIDLRGNNISVMNWKGSPCSLKQIYLDDNPDIKITWEDAPRDLDSVSIFNGLEGDHNNDIIELNFKGVPWNMTFKESYNRDVIFQYNYDQYKFEHPYLNPSKPLLALVDELLHVSLFPPGLSDKPVFKKGGRLPFGEYVVTL